MRVMGGEKGPDANPCLTSYKSQNPDVDVISLLAKEKQIWFLFNFTMLYIAGAGCMMGGNAIHRIGTFFKLSKIVHLLVKALLWFSMYKLKFRFIMSLKSTVFYFSSIFTTVERITIR